MEQPTEQTAASIVAGLANRKQLATDLNRSERTIIRLEHMGLPVIRLGMLRFYNPARVRDWLISQERCHEAPKRGRRLGRKAI